MKRPDMAQIRQAAERAIQALEELEAALHEGDHRKIGARMAELRWQLKAIQKLVDTGDNKL